ncbi:GTPase domain-containing protein [Kineosporia sp. A_224]|uniref:GTPase domain-containing protein n=1 Tax=Kineosporia sp. A_224 TaxID=1962180 RepID=UPI000B4B5CB7|nr:GTPase domain-containing protein [Kineosporia sp. A_224]
MTDLLFHSAAAAERDLVPRLDALLGQLPAAKTLRLRRMLIVEQHDRPRMVLTGQYSSGKSTLVKALTDGAAEVLIDSAVATSDVQVFDWDGLVELVDTPGVQAGLEVHDALAEEALRNADLVLFTVSVDLFDDRLVAHLRHVTDDLRKASQLLVVITKCRSLKAADGVRQAAVREALGHFADQVPWVECDARTYLDALHEDDGSRAEIRAEASRIGMLRRAINRIARERGDLARFRVPLQQVALVAGEALAAVAEDEADEAALAVLARQRRAFTNRRGLLDSALERRATEFRSACIRAAEQLADMVEAIEVSPAGEWGRLDDASARLDEQLNLANERFVDGVREIVQSQLADFSSEVREIEASPYAHQLAALDVRADVEARVISVEPGSDRLTRQKPVRLPPWAPKVTEHLKKFQRTWGAGDGVRASAGSTGHQIVYNVGKRVGVKFKPYQAVRWADNIGKVARYGNLVLPVALEVHAILQEERGEEAAAKEKFRRRRALVGAVLAQCEVISGATLAQVRGEFATAFDAAVREIDEMHEVIRAVQASRSDLDRELASVQREAHSMLDRLEAPAAPESVDM